MTRIVECVPNFSEGRDMEIIDRIAAEVRAVEGVELLDVDPGKDTNRTVVTFAGSPEKIGEAAFRAIRKAAELIDMAKHSGAHARLGATDVCPFVPVSGVTMADCVEIARQVGERVARELAIPVYLYAEAATRPDRRRLPDIRRGEYEALPEKLKNEDFKPDFGAAEFNPRSGATVIGARDFLIAYNVNLNTRDVGLANKIAKRVREKGYIVKNPQTGKKETVPGTLTGVQGIGWYIDEYNMAQVSVNILNFHETPLHRVFEECDRFAREFGVRVTGSELVGLIPLEAMVVTGKHFLSKQGVSTGVSEKELVRVAVQSLGLDELAPFDASKRIIEYRFRRPGRLASMDTYAFTEELASDSPAPGGGSVSALMGSLSAGLSTMVANLTSGKPKFKPVREEMIRLAEEGQELIAFFNDAIDRDTEAFNRIMDALSLPKGSEEEIALRKEALDVATRGAVCVPLGVLEKAVRAVTLAHAAAEKGNPNSLSDAGVAGLAAAACARGAWYNVSINLMGYEDRTFVRETLEKANQWMAQVEEAAARIHGIMEKALK
ncbi:MAG: glutamate formimidoyltransferase [Acidobacteriota bacterium]|jgi:glutamate formiminotransferase/formiminotetrahydrofolate cyclodeaminase|nr:glutamate formimidoyltransferase [Acidobacteriota bacterium]